MRSVVHASHTRDLHRRPTHGGDDRTTDRRWHLRNLLWAVRMGCVRGVTDVTKMARRTMRFFDEEFFVGLGIAVIAIAFLVLPLYLAGGL